MHGPLRVYRGKSYSRWFWTSTVTLSIILLLFQVSTLLEIYNSRPTVSQVINLIF